MGFTLPHWAEICPVQRFGVESRLWCPSVHLAFLSLEEVNSLSAGGIYPVTKHCPLSTCMFKCSASVTSIPAGSGQSWRRGFPSSWCLDGFVISSYALKCTCLVPAAGRAGVWRAALVCTGFVSSNTTGVSRGWLLSGPSSTWWLWIWAVIKYRAIFILCVPLWVSCW